MFVIGNMQSGRDSGTPWAVEEDGPASFADAGFTGH